MSFRVLAATAALAIAFGFTGTANAAEAKKEMCFKSASVTANKSGIVMKMVLANGKVAEAAIPYELAAHEMSGGSMFNPKMRFDEKRMLICQPMPEEVEPVRTLPKNLQDLVDPAVPNMPKDIKDLTK